MDVGDRRWRMDKALVLAEPSLPTDGEAVQGVAEPMVPWWWWMLMSWAPDWMICGGVVAVVDGW